MSFSERDKLKALAIVHIFETGKPFGDYAAVAVLNDGAGVSYGINQFTHRSGSLEAVVRRFHRICEQRRTQKLLDGYERLLQDRSVLAIRDLSADQRFKNGLRAAAKRDEMQQAQREIAFEKYLKPALDACEGSDFKHPLSLAVIYDSINHGSYEKIRDRVRIPQLGSGSFERRWIATYVHHRDEWLESIPRLRSTAYRTDFFLVQIARNNWSLTLPVTVHGYKLTDTHIEAMLPADTSFGGLTDREIDRAVEVPRAAEPRQDPQIDPQESPSVRVPTETAAVPRAEAPSQIAENIVNVEGERAVPENFVPEEKTADAPAPTGFMAKLKFHLAGLGIGGGLLTALKELFGISLAPETVELLKVVLPTVLVLGFLCLIVWYVSEKVVGFKTLKMQSEINTDPARHNLRIRPQ